jgi:hypothetical protein
MRRSSAFESRGSWWPGIRILARAPASAALFGLLQFLLVELLLGDIPKDAGKQAPVNAAGPR